MTGEEWLACRDGTAMIKTLWIESRRKRQLFCVACARRVLFIACDRRCEEALRVTEAYLDGQATEEQVQIARDFASDCCHEQWESAGPNDRVTLAREVIVQTSTVRDIHPDRIAGSVAAAIGTREAEGWVHADLVREIVGWPFSKPKLDHRWCSSDVSGLARGIYEDRAFDRMPILADALMDAGCDDDQIISHCRAGGPHVRGCWVVDLVLGKE